MEEDDLQIYLTSDQLGANGTPITIDSVKNMTIGAKVSTANSTYIVQPVFDLSLLDKDNYIDVNLSSGTQAVTEIKLVSNSSASSHSGQERYDFTLSGSYGGLKASAAYHQENKRQDASSDGTVNVTMSYNNSGAYVAVLTGGFNRNASFTSYLVGAKLDDATVKSRVAYTEAYVTGQTGDKYVKTVTIVNNGQLDDQENAYGNIQLLGEMERIFSLLRTQYNTYSDATIRKTLTANMLLMKGYISNAIQQFYSYHGDSFVSHISAMNYGMGNGQLQFGSSSGNSENIYDAALAVSYSGLGFGGSGSANVGGARQSGWATAYKNTVVTARSLPAGVIDTTAWANSLFSMLSNEASPISVPALSNLPVMGTLTLPAPVEKKKSPAEPPDSCFSSYDEWKTYQQDKKKTPDQDRAQAEAAEAAVEAKGAAASSQPGGGGPSLYQDYERELRLLKNGRRVFAPSVQGSNIMRVDKMFVSGFDTTAYDQVIPQLRPNLDIPGQSTKIAGFPNISILLMIVDRLGQLNSYLHFLSGFAISKVSPDMSNLFNTFYSHFRDNAFDMIALQLSQGVDLNDALLTSFSVEMLGKEGGDGRESRLYKALGNIDAYNYIVKTLLEPHNAQIWSSAPGGYIPFVWDQNNQLGFLNLKGIRYSGSGDYFLTDDDVIPYTDPMKNPLSLYEENKATLKSPWFPVFQYKQSKPSALLFLQTAGPYQIIRGLTYAAYPNGVMTFNQMNPSLNASVTSSLADYLGQVLNNFNQSYRYFLSWDYSLYFANATQKDPDMVKKYRVLTLAIGYWGVPSDPPAPPMSNYWIDFAQCSYPTWIRKGIKNIYKTANGSMGIADMAKQEPFSDTNGPVMLLPINSTTCGAKFNNAFSYATNFAAADIVPTGSYDAAYKAALSQ
ncbi:MAG: hypothetical protein NTW71_02750 [Deltaproteobacteria bacterium]|nr:hypothetical protein [Deltaproteobacteria bacterium]